MIFNNILEFIGNTPLIKINNLVDQDMADIYAKLEGFNPGGSIKDRIAYAMIKDAEKQGVLKNNGTIIEATSGNTGIGLALIGKVLGYKVILTMPETMSLERIYIQKSFGAEIVLTQANLGMIGAVKKAEELFKKIPNSFIPQQFKNKANPEIHRKTTAVEILKNIDKPIDAFVAAVGTGGTVTGVGEVLKEKNSNTKIIAIEPETSAVISGKKPGAHKIQGIGSGFIPEILNLNIIDEIVTVSDNDAYEMSKILALKEGILAGISSGANLFVSIKIAKRFGKGKTIVTIFPDTGERYFSIERFFKT